MNLALALFVVVGFAATLENLDLPGHARALGDRSSRFLEGLQDNSLKGREKTGRSTTFSTAPARLLRLRTDQLHVYVHYVHVGRARPDQLIEGVEKRVGIVAEMLLGGAARSLGALDGIRRRTGPRGVRRAVDSVGAATQNHRWSLNILQRERPTQRHRLVALPFAVVLTVTAGFIHTRRLQHADALLRTGTDTVSDVASAVGYRDPSYFSRLFRETFGCSPTEYAEQETAPPDDPDFTP